MVEPLSRNGIAIIYDVMWNYINLVCVERYIEFRSRKEFTIVVISR